MATKMRQYLPLVVVLAANILFFSGMICPRHCARSQKGAREVRAMLRVLHISLPLLLLAASACKSWGKFWQRKLSTLRTR
jgi:hypothetical protein